MAAVVFRPSQIPPPTPPKIAAHRTEHAQRFLEDHYELDLPLDASNSQQRGNADLETPPQSSPLHSDSGASKQIKEVKFLAQPFPDDIPITLRRVPSSRLQKCSKSILKAHTPSPSYDSSKNPFFCPDGSSKAPPSFADMLQSVVQMLAGTDLASRLDAYRVLMRSLRAHEQLPDRKALRDKLPLLESFIQRDVAAKQVDPSSKALSLSALKLSIVLLETYPAGTFDGTFLTFILEQATDMVKYEHPPKDLALHYMQLLALPQLFSKCTQLDRLQELLKDLETVSDRISGMNVYRLRLMIYQQMVQRSGTLMVDMTERWLPHVFHGMLSDNADLRSRAIEAAMSAGTAIGTSKTLSQNVVGLLHREESDNMTYATHFEKRLAKLMQNSDENQSVPQIWGAVMLLLRGSPTVAEKWLCSTAWLKILQKCFNSSTTKLTTEALFAWDRTIYAFGASLSTKMLAVKTLRAPIVGLLQRPMHARLKTAVLSTYCTLLYYAFAPATAAENLNQCWKILVHDVCLQVLQKTAAEAQSLGQILSAMFLESEVKVWNPHRGLETRKTPVRLNEVPRLDPGWVRRNISTLSQVILPLLLATQRHDTAVDRTSSQLWPSLLTTLSEAGSKEVMVSLDAKRAFAETINILYRLWPSSSTVKEVGHRQVRIAEVLVSLAENVVSIMSLVHFVDKILLRTESGSFEAMQTPTRHGLSRSRRPQSPLLAILELLLASCGSSEASEHVRDGLRTIIRACLETKANVLLKLKFLEESAQVLAPTADPGNLEKNTKERQPDVFTIEEALMHCLLELSFSSISEMPSKSTENSPHTGIELNHALMILQISLRFPDSRSLELGQNLHRSIRDYTRGAAGDAGVLVAVNEPLVLFLNSNMSHLSLPAVLSYMKGVLDAGVTITSQKVLEHARKALWDQPPAAHDSSGLGWLKVLYTAIGSALSLSYAQCENLSAVTTQSFIMTLASFLRSASESSRGTIPGPELFLWHVSGGLCLWAEDVDGKIFAHRASSNEVQVAVKVLWMKAMTLISQFPLKSNAQLRSVEHLLCAGFQSRSKAIANSAISTWNSTFGAEETLEYSKTLAHVLHRLQSLVELSLPTFPKQQLDDQQSINSDSLPDLEDDAMFPWLSYGEDSQFPMPQAASPFIPSSSVGRIFGAATRKSEPPTSKPAPLLVKPALKQNTPARMRHEDSQVEFVAIGSSPQDPSAAESQLLTERQKETRQRQQVEHFLFKDIRSSASPSTPRRGRDSACNSARSADKLRSLGEPADHIQSDEESLPAMIDSSPIERARRGRSPHTASTMINPVKFHERHRAEEEEIPSSPPEVSIEDDLGQRADAGPGYDHVQVDDSMAATNLAVESSEDQVQPNAAQVSEQPAAAQLDVTDGAKDSEEEAVQAVAMSIGDEGEENHPPPMDPSVPQETEAAAPHKNPSESLEALVQTDAPDDIDPQMEEPRSPVSEYIAVPNTAELELSQPEAPKETITVVQDSIMSKEQSADQEDPRLDHGSFVTDTPEPLEQARAEVDASSQSSTSSQRMVATFVSVPSRTANQAYEDRSREDPIVSEELVEEESRTIRLGKRKAAEATSESISKKARTSDSQESVIRCRPASSDSPSLRELAITSSLFVGLRSPAATPERATQNHSASASSRKRSSPMSSQEDDAGDSVADASILSQGKPGRKRAKTAQTSQQSAIATPSQSSQKKRRKGKLASPAAVHSTPTRRLRSSARGKSPLPSADTSFREGDSFFDAASPTPLLASNKAVVPSPWNDTTVDITANLASAGNKTSVPGLDEAVTNDSPVDVTTATAPAADTMNSQTSVVAPITEADIIKSSDPAEQTPPALDEALLASSRNANACHDNDAELATSPSAAPPQSPLKSTPAPIPQTTSATVPPPDAQPDTQQSLAATPPTPTSLARSILGRLRGLLADCRTLVLGPSSGAAAGDGGVAPEEVEELQDLAHELQGELLRARRRGREL